MNESKKVTTTIYIEISPILREFIISYFKDGVIYAGRNSYLAKKIKHLLDVPPIGYFPKKPECCIEIELTDFYFKRVKRKCVHTEYRNYLSPEAQRNICKEIEDLFKSSFRNFVAGYTISSGVKYGSISNAIYEYMKFYNMPNEKINFEMLFRDWNRSNEKKKIEINKFNKKSVASCPNF